MKKKHTNVNFNYIETAQDAPDAPLPLFEQWYEDAQKDEPRDPNAMCLSTIGPDNTPQSRMVLMKTLDERGLVFYTNQNSNIPCKPFLL